MSSLCKASAGNSSFRWIVASCALTLTAGLLRLQADPQAAGPLPLSPRVLRVAADPNNLPFSNQALQGFENRIATLLARDLGAELEYVWHAQRRGFFRETLKSGDCDLVLGVPTDIEMALTTRPYYRSSYVFVRRKAEMTGLNSFDDPILRRVKVGVQLVGNDGVNTPPAHALAARGIVTNVVGYTLYGNYSQPNPPARILEAVAGGAIDVAVVWGPLAGYFASREALPLELTPLESAKDDRSGLSLAFDISLGVRRRDKALRDRLDEILEHRQAEIEQILNDYGVPRLPLSPAGARRAESK